MPRSKVNLAEDYPLPKRKIRWVGIVFFLIIHLVGLIGTPIYLFYRGITSVELALFVGFLVATGMSTTLGYHRLFAHRTFKTSAPVQFLCCSSAQRLLKSPR